MENIIFLFTYDVTDEPANESVGKGCPPKKF
jgi:hypothetical protein